MTVNSTPSDISASTGIEQEIDAGQHHRWQLGSATGAVKAKLAKVKLPVGLHIELLGEAAERAAAQTRLLEYGLGAAIAILFLLQAAFDSVRLAVLMFLTLRWRWSAACWQRGAPWARSPSGRWSDSSPCSESPPATAS